MKKTIEKERLTTGAGKKVVFMLNKDEANKLDEIAQDNQESTSHLLRTIVKKFIATTKEKN